MQVGWLLALFVAGWLAPGVHQAHHAWAEATPALPDACDHAHAAAVEAPGFARLGDPCPLCLSELFHLSAPSRTAATRLVFSTLTALPGEIVGSFSPTFSRSRAPPA